MPVVMLQSNVDIKMSYISIKTRSEVLQFFTNLLHIYLLNSHFIV